MGLRKGTIRRSGGTGLKSSSLETTLYDLIGRFRRPSPTCARWKSQKRTKSLFGKYDPQLQIVGGKAYYVWNEDHGPTEPIWVAIEILD